MTKHKNRRVDWGLVRELVTDTLVLAFFFGAIWWGLVILWAMEGGM